MKLLAATLSLAAAFASLVAPFTCSPQAADWGLDAITTLPTPADPPLVCPLTIPTDPAAAQRESCAFGQGSLPAQTLGIPAALSAQIPIRHIIIMMKENRSFDHLFGNLNSEGQPNTEAEPVTFTNPDMNGTPVAPFHEPTTCVPIDPGHQSESVSACLASGAMSGFVQNAALTSGTDGHSVMGNYDSTDLPFYFWLASTYALSDRHFAAVASGTFANRNFYLFANKAGTVDTGITYPNAATPSILQLLMNAGFTWAAYTDSQPFSGTADWDATSPGVHSFQDFLNACDQGTLPNVAFVDGVEDTSDDHPTADLQAGEAWSYQVYQHVAASPEWPRLAMIWTYDEAGGFADHVPPPTACIPSPSNSQWTQMGPRVPLVVISQWAKLGYVSHVVHDHTAITRFIETVFNLPALTARDANSDALLDLFDFTGCGEAVTPPGPAPQPGDGGCTMSAL